MYGNKALSYAPCVMTPYMMTKIAAPDKGLTIEYTAKRNGSVQLDSITQPSQAAIRNERHEVDVCIFSLFSIMSLRATFLFFAVRCAKMQWRSNLIIKLEIASAGLDTPLRGYSTNASQRHIICDSL